MTKAKQHIKNNKKISYSKKIVEKIPQNIKDIKEEYGYNSMSECPYCDHNNCNCWEKRDKLNDDPIEDKKIIYNDYYDSIKSYFNNLERCHRCTSFIDICKCNKCKECYSYECICDHDYNYYQYNLYLNDIYNIYDSRLPWQFEEYEEYY